MLLRALQRDEHWLQDRLAAEPEVLGLGPLALVGQEVSHTAGGLLDLLLEREDTYFSVEVQLGVLDASHGFRTLEYWARNTRRWPEKQHVAVVVAERMHNRYGRALQTLTDYLPLVAVELHAEADHGDDIRLTHTIVAAHSDLGLEVAAPTGAVSDRTPESWREQATAAAWDALTEFVNFTDTRLGPAYFDYSAASHITVRRGRRLWATVRLTETGITLNMADLGGGRIIVGKRPSVAFEAMRETAAAAGVAMVWQPASAGGARPVSLRLRPGDVNTWEVQQVLKACWDAIEDVEGAVVRSWQPRRLHDRSWEDDRGFEPYYTVEYHEVGLGGARSISTLVYWSSFDESEVLWSVTDEEEWDDQEFARRILLHHTERAPTKKLRRRFLAGPACDWEIGTWWSLEAKELTAWLDEHA
jgi:hypothetical protein